MTAGTNYRKRIYAEYASRFQDADLVFDIAAANRWGCSYDSYLKGWMPEQKDSAILEVACGDGRLLHFFKTRGYSNLTGVDISPEQVRLARQVLENVFESDALEFLEAKNKTYDLIIGLDIVEHFKKDELFPFLDACYHGLRPGGCLILQTPNAESPWGLMHRYHDLTHELAFDPNSLKRLLAIVGFSKITSREAGPVVHGVISLGRYLIWRAIRAGLTLWNLAETGSKGSGIYTRVFLISGIKQRD